MSRSSAVDNHPVGGTSLRGVTRQEEGEVASGQRGKRSGLRLALKHALRSLKTRWITTQRAPLPCMALHCR